MSAKAPTTVVSALALDTAALSAATKPRLAGGEMGEAGSRRPSRA